MQQELWTYVIVNAAPKIENLLFFIYIRNTFRHFFHKTIELMLSFEHLALKMNGDFCLFFMILYMYHYFKVKVSELAL